MAFLLLCRKSHKIPSWMLLWHLCIMQEWDSCIHGSIKNISGIIQQNPSPTRSIPAFVSRACAISTHCPAPLLLYTCPTVLATIHGSWDGHLQLPNALDAWKIICSRWGDYILRTYTDICSYLQAYSYSAKQWRTCFNFNHLLKSSGLCA